MFRAPTFGGATYGPCRCATCGLTVTAILDSNGWLHCLNCSSPFVTPIIYPPNPNPNPNFPFFIPPIFHNPYFLPPQDSIIIPPRSNPLTIANLRSTLEDDIVRAVAERSFHDPNHYGPPPAARAAVESLESFWLTPETTPPYECSVCKTPFETGVEVKQIPCEFLHIFHSHCILQWLDVSNNCPICQFELSTDDSEYERKKMAAVGPSDSGSGAKDRSGNRDEGNSGGRGVGSSSAGS